MKKYETFSTTADVGIRIRGSGFDDLLKNAVNGLNLLYFGDPGDNAYRTSDPNRCPFEFHGDSRENVLVNFLSEIVFLLQNENKMATAVDFKEVGETHLKADLLTIPADREPEMEIKSVTYHNLEIKENNGILSTEVIFDV